MIDLLTLTIHKVAGGFLKKSKTELKLRLKNFRMLNGAIQLSGDQATTGFPTTTGEVQG